MNFYLEVYEVSMMMSGQRTTPYFTLGSSVNKIPLTKNSKNQKKKLLN